MGCMHAAQTCGPVVGPQKKKERGKWMGDDAGLTAADTITRQCDGHSIAPVATARGARFPALPALPGFQWPSDSHCHSSRPVVSAAAIACLCFRPMRVPGLP